MISVLPAYQVSLHDKSVEEARENYFHLECYIAGKIVVLNEG